ncbi:hypothetical protein GCM10023096_61240 [Nonomuraea ferruginea]
MRGGDGWQEPWQTTRATVLRVDGSDRTTVPGDALMQRPPIRDRLALLRVPTVEGDDSIPRSWGRRHSDTSPRVSTAARAAALLGTHSSMHEEMPWTEIKTGVWAPDGPLLYWRTDGDQFVVADLGGIDIASSPCPA